MASRALTVTGLQSRFKLRYDDTLQAQEWNKFARVVRSNQPDGETYNGAKGVSGMAEAKGQDRKTTIPGEPFSITNRKFQGGLEIEGLNWRWNKTGDTTFKVRQLAQNSAAHPGSLMEGNITDGESVTGPDGVAFYATTHPVLATTMSNLFSTGYFAVTGAQPTTTEWGNILLYAVTTMSLFKDDQGNFVNRGLTSLSIAVDPSLYPSLLKALAQNFMGSGETNPLRAINKYTFLPVLLPATDQSTKVYFIANNQSSFIVQYLEEPNKLIFLGDQSEFGKINDQVRAIVRGYYNVGKDRWQGAACGTLS